MGLDRNTRTPCGFCFVEYYTHAEALASMKYVSGTKLDERIVRCDLDLGYKEGRQFGRGKSGGQVRDEHRQDYDPGRGGWGAQAQVDRRREVEERYADAQEGPGAVASGGGEWKEVETRGSFKRGRSPEDEGDNARLGHRLRMDDPEAERIKQQGNPAVIALHKLAVGTWYRRLQAGKQSCVSAELYDMSQILTGSE
ncbi:hypothetical protein BS17DRAFT_764062 [Gyrodon lividus]|nr:hypothetical protein BS17DRAFT_764062 [Gyrodon lividus]